MRLDKRKECFKDRDLVILTCYQTQHSAHLKHCSASPGALWDGHLLLHPTVDEKRALSLNPEGSLLSFTALFFTVEAALNKQVNYHHQTLPARMLSSTACCCYRSCEILNRYLPKQQQLVSPGSDTLWYPSWYLQSWERKWMWTPCGQQSKQAEKSSSTVHYLGLTGHFTPLRLEANKAFRTGRYLLVHFSMHGLERCYFTFHPAVSIQTEDWPSHCSQKTGPQIFWISGHNIMLCTDRFWKA